MHPDERKRLVAAWYKLWDAHTVFVLSYLMWLLFGCLVLMPVWLGVWRPLSIILPFAPAALALFNRAVWRFRYRHTRDLREVHRV